MSGRRAGVRTALALAVGSFVLYNANVREISSQDTIPTRVLPHEVIAHGRLDLDRLFQDWPATAPLPYWVQRVGSHYRSNYPVAPAILAVPIYLVPVLLGADGSWVWLNLLSKLAASLFAAASVAFVYLAACALARRLAISEGSALAAAVVYAAATPTWAVSSQGLWGHAPAQLCLAVGLWVALRPGSGPAALGLGGLATALMVASRPPTAWLGLAIGAYLLRVRGPGVWPFLALGGAIGLAAFGYNVWTFGSLQGGYAELHGTHARWHGVEGAWSAAGLPEGLMGLLVSPSRGVFVYSPVLVAAFGGLYRGFRSRDAFLRWLAFGVGGSLLGLGVFTVWWGGHSFGPRLLADVMPALVLGIVPAWPALQRSRPLRWLLGVAFAASILIQAVGAFHYPSPRGVDWDTSPRDVDHAHERLWDWRDPQLLRLLRNGPATPGFRTGP